MEEGEKEERRKTKGGRGGGFFCHYLNLGKKKINIGEGGSRNVKHLLNCCHVVGCWRLECTLVLIKPS